MKNAAMIVGATGGIGTAYAKQLAAAKTPLILVDRSKARLNKLAAQLQKEYRIQTAIIVTNLASKASVEVLASQISQLRSIDKFIYAAGYGEKMKFKDETIKAVMDMISVHNISVVRLIHALLPAMLRRRKGSIIVVSSLASFIPAPGSSIYSATKSFVNAFLESLHMEVNDKGIRVQSLCPGLTHTGFHSKEDIKRFENSKGLNLWMEADEVVSISLASLENDKVICIPGFINKSIRTTADVLPRKTYYTLVEKLSERSR